MMDASDKKSFWFFSLEPGFEKESKIVVDTTKNPTCFQTSNQYSSNTDPQNLDRYN